MPPDPPRVRAAARSRTGAVDNEEQVAFVNSLSVCEVYFGQVAADLSPQLNDVDGRKLPRELGPSRERLLPRWTYIHLWQRWSRRRRRRARLALIKRPNAGSDDDEESYERKH